MSLFSFSPRHFAEANCGNSVVCVQFPLRIPALRCRTTEYVSEERYEREEANESVHPARWGDRSRGGEEGEKSNIGKEAERYYLKNVLYYRLLLTASMQMHLLCVCVGIDALNRVLSTC